MKACFAISLFTLSALTCATTASATDLSIPIPIPSERKSTALKIEKPTDKIDLPKPEPERIYQAACPAVMLGMITAKAIPPIKDGQCGERSPLQVTAFGNIELSQPITLNCRMATNLSKWAKQTRDLAQSILDKELTGLQVSTSYQCRRRNNAPTGKISEHGFANALDISGLRFENDIKMSIEANWQPELDKPLEARNSNRESLVTSDYSTLPDAPRFLRAARDAACAYFTTVLSPEANAAHADHLHLDLGCHGKSCTYLICE